MRLVLPKQRRSWFDLELIGQQLAVACFELSVSRSRGVGQAGSRAGRGRFWGKMQGQFCAALQGVPLPWGMFYSPLVLELRS